MKGCFIPNYLVSLLCGMCSRLDEQVAFVCESAKIDLRQSDAHNMYYVGIIAE